MAKEQRIEEAAQIGQLEFGYVDWDVELPNTKERWYKVMRQISQLLVPQGDDEGLLTDEGIGKASLTACRECKEQSPRWYAECFSSRCIKTHRATAKAQLDLTRQERLNRPESRKKIGKYIMRHLNPSIDGAFLTELGCENHADQILIHIPDEEEIRKKVKAIQNPYTAEFFPRDDKWAGQILREKGLTDDEIGGVSGALGRVAFEYIMAEIDRRFEP